MRTNLYPKKICIAIAILICIIIGTGWIVTVSKEEKNTHIIITSIPIESIDEKFHDEDGYYLTVNLESWLVESYHLSYDKISFKTDEEIYNQIFPGDSFTGVSLKIAWPEKSSNIDLGSVLKEKPNGSCEIISVTRTDNSVID